MAEFNVLIEQVIIEEHDNADALELARIKDYRAVVATGIHKDGDLVAYIPEQAIVPNWLIEKMGLTGRLAGSKKNRVKAVKLRGKLSQGLVLPLIKSDCGCVHTIQNDTNTLTVQLGTDVTEFLGITKYEPTIPSHMAGEVFNANGDTIKFDIENIKNHPDVLVDDEDIVITEKLHGTWACFGKCDDGRIITSKGLSKRGLAFKMNEANEHNLYIKTYHKLESNYVAALNAAAEANCTPSVYILGEIYGTGIQDLQYGDSGVYFRAFDIYVGRPGNGRYLNYDEFVEVCERFEIERCPILYRGPYSRTIVDVHTNGKETVSGSAICIREGGVVKPTIERRDYNLGRVHLKSISEAYLLRKGNTTEYT